jgi:ceramide glucosyltransferase
MPAIAGILLCSCIAGCCYLALALQRTLAFGRPRRRGAARTKYAPAVTILKPLCGDEPDLYENLCSFCDQDYPSFQVVFGIRDASDPAATVARRVRERFAQCDTALVVDDRVHAPNLKMANVLNMAACAKHDIIVVADSDVRVDRSYLSSVVAPFADDRVGAVTCLYRGVARRPRLWSELGAMFVNEQFAPSVLVALALSPMDFCLGATMAVTRDALDAIGGFNAIASHLADDQMLGRLVRAQGRRVELSAAVVETTVCDPDVRRLWEHELRWARTMRAARPWGYSFSFITFALPLAIAYALVSPGIMSVALLGLSAVLRLALHYATRSAFRIRCADSALLIPLRDALSLAVWATHFFGRHVRWRGASYRVDSTGRLMLSD